ncbi:hypothetical protein [Streptomyces sp. NBC_01217]|uniref:hypothetical protein n=1 Tax=Streptomyces sp. NBC_01217 TaxID=2903779 RepID=UPI002E0D93D3|nr:hypothetical protein OG507_34080 [Streptomyces sp. NBC_01217]
MQSSHAAAKVSARFDDPNLVGYGGLEPVVRLAERCGLPALANEHVRLPVSKDGTGAFPAAKLMSLVGGMVAGADSIDDMDRLRHGALPRLFVGVRAPSTLGSFLRSFTHGHVKQLHAVARRFLPELAAHAGLLSGAESVAYVDIDDTIRRTYGYAKQGAGYGYSKVKGLNALLGIVSPPGRTRRSPQSPRGSSRAPCPAPARSHSATVRPAIAATLRASARPTTPDARPSPPGNTSSNRSTWDVAPTLDPTTPSS